MKDDLNEMLERLGKAVGSGDLPGISACYAFPAMIVSDEGSIIFENADQVEQMFAKGREWYISKGILTTRAELESFEQLTDMTAAIDVRWPGFDKDGTENYTETSHYIVQAIKGKPLIRVALTRTK